MAKITESKKRSLLNKYFNVDICIEILKITMISNADNNDKSVLIKECLKKHNIPFTGLGSGTNRMAVLIDGYAVKIALDQDGCVDNKREMLYTKALQPYVIKVYECIPSGLLAVTEYVEIFTLSEFHKYKDDMLEILSDIATNFLIGDCGVSGKNYVNWGTRNDGTICILDFAYIYSVKFNIFNCTCNSESLLRYDANYVNLVCPLCGKKYTFGEIRRRITRKQQEEEIGDIRRLGYNLTKEEEIVTLNPEFEPKTEEKKKKEKSETDLLIEAYEKGELNKFSSQDWDNPNQDI